jgi:hypothetical protein
MMFVYIFNYNFINVQFNLATYIKTDESLFYMKKNVAVLVAACLDGFTQGGE